MHMQTKNLLRYGVSAGLGTVPEGRLQANGPPSDPVSGGRCRDGGRANGPPQGRTQRHRPHQAQRLRRFRRLAKKVSSTLSDDNSKSIGKDCSNLSSLDNSKYNSKGEIFSEKIEFLQLNCNKSKASMACALDTITNCDGPGVLCLTEPFQYRRKVVGLSGPGRQLFYVYDKDQRPRSAILVIGNLSATFLPQFSNSDITSVIFTYQSRSKPVSLLCISAYMPGDYGLLPPGTLIENIMEFAASQRLQVLLCTDSNAHSSLWGCPNTDRRGEKLTEFLAKWDIELCNIGNLPTFVSIRGQSIIDLTCASIFRTFEIRDWRVSDKDFLSDHRAIQFHVDSDPIEQPTYRNPKKCDWVAYSRIVRDKLSSFDFSFNSVVTIEKCIVSVEETMLTAFNLCCPMSTRPRGKKVPYWTSSLTVLRRICRSKYQSWKRTGCLDRYEEYRIARRKFQRELNTGKRDCWRSWCSFIQQGRPASRLIKLLSKDHVNHLSFLRKPDGNFTSTIEESLELLLSTFFPGSKLADDELEGVNCFPRKGVTQKDCDLINRIVTGPRLRWAVSCLQPFKAPGPDGIYPQMVKIALDALEPILIKVYRFCLLYGYLPNSFRLSKVVFIPKPGKDNYFECKSFRPISLTHILLRLCERLVHRYLMDGPLRVHPLHRNQHAYIPGRSCETNLHCLVSMIEKSLSRGEFAVALCADVQSAFDTISFKSISSGLKRHRVPWPIQYFVKNILSCRLARAQVGSWAKTVNTQVGCPQGGVLSPILYALGIDELLVQLNNLGIHCQMFADDICVLVRGHALDVCHGLLLNALSHIDRFLSAQGLKLSPSKSELIVFTRKYKWSWPRLIFRGQEVQRRDQIKFLGLVLDSRLTWNPMIRDRVDKCVRSVFACNRVVARTWGLSPKVMYYVYTQIIRPRLTYACVCWWNKATQAAIKTQLNRLQRLALLMVTGAMKTCPGVTLEFMLDILPLDKHIYFTAAMSAYRMRQTGRWQDGQGHGKLLQEVSRLVPEFSMFSDFMLKRFSFNHKFDVFIPAREEWDMGNWPPDNPNLMSFYCDGSRDETIGFSGAGVISADRDYMLDLVLPLGKYTSSYSCEISAINHCVLNLLQCKVSNKDIIIYSDCQAALLGLKAYSFHSRLVYETFCNLQKLSKHNRVALAWVPGHSGFELNELADSVARSAVMANNDYFLVEPLLPITITYCKSTLCEVLRRLQIDAWRLRSDVRQSRLMMSKPQKNHVKWLLRLSRGRLRLITYVLSGHGPVNRHLHLMNLVPSAQCTFCRLESETMVHYIAVCPKWSRCRAEIFGSEYLSNTEILDLPWPPILQFMELTGRFNL